MECGKVQLVGLAAIVFIEQASVAEFRGFQIVKAKTAIKGLAGNKGALLCRFEYVHPVNDGLIYQSL